MLVNNEVILKEYNMNKMSRNRRERFKRLATSRTNAVLKKLKVLGNCANRQAYDYTEEDIEKIFSSIEKYAKLIKAKFQFTKHEDFKL